MKFNRIIRIILTLVVLFILCLSVSNFIARIKEKEGYKHTYIWETINKLENNELEINDIRDVGIVEVLDILFYDESVWNKLPLTSNFIKKFKNPKGIIRKYNKYESIGVGLSREYQKNNVIFVDCVERDNFISLIRGKDITTYYTFEYIVDDNNKLDDLKLLKEVDIDSMTAETYAVREYE